MWVAVYFFDVDADVVEVLFIFCVLFVAGLILLGFLGIPLIRLLRKETPLLSKIKNTEEVNQPRESG